MNVLVLSFDQLSLSWLGCYGNEWLPTPNFDRLAAHAVLFDQYYVEDVQPNLTGHAWWDGRYHFRGENPVSTKPQTIFSLAEQVQIDAQLYAEGEHQSEHWIPFRKSDDWKLLGSGEFSSIETLVEQGQAAIRSSDPESPHLIWLKALGELSEEIPAVGFLEKVAEWEGLEPTEELLTEWLVVMSQPELFEQLDEEQQQDLKNLFDAARILELDEQIGLLWDELANLENAADWRFVVTSGRGDADEAKLSTGLVNVPLIVGCPAWKTTRRRKQLVQSVDLPVTFLEWLGEEGVLENCEGKSFSKFLDDPQLVTRDFACFGRGAKQVGLSSGHYFVTAAIEDDSQPLVDQQCELYVLPEDRLNLVDVSGQDFVVLETVVNQLQAICDHAKAGQKLIGSLFENQSIREL